MMEISEKEFAVIKEIADNHLPDQRKIADGAGISLGLTNLIIKRLVNRGYVKVKQLTQKKIQYLLTPEGFAEKAKKSYYFTLKTINILKSAKEKIRQLIINEHNKGINEFVIAGNSELADIAEIVFNNILAYNNKITYTRKREDLNIVKPAELICKMGEETHSVDLISYLSNTGFFLG